jgi:hypothetical protein
MERDEKQKRKYMSRNNVKLNRHINVMFVHNQIHVIQYKRQKEEIKQNRIVIVHCSTLSLKQKGA